MYLAQDSLFYQDGFLRRNSPLSFFAAEFALSTAGRLQVASEDFCIPLNHT